jgi:hypothetical protein
MDVEGRGRFDFATFNTDSPTRDLAPCEALLEDERQTDILAFDRDRMDTALPPTVKGQARRMRPSRTERHRSANVELWQNHFRNGGPEMNVATYGLDVAIRVVQPSLP